MSKKMFGKCVLDTTKGLYWFKDACKKADKGDWMNVFMDMSRADLAWENLERDCHPKLNWAYHRNRNRIA